MIGLVLAIAAWTVAPGARAEPRLALVIGETNYALAPMATPGNDAGAIAQALAQAGFDVKAYAGLDRDGLHRAFADLLVEAKRAGSDASVFVFLAGHGVQFNGENYIVPVEATLARDVDVPGEAVRLNDLGRDLAALPLRARVLVYDLANANAFAPLASGLAVVDPPAGMLVAFNAAPGAVALPDKAAYGIYAQSLSEMMAVPDLPLETMFTRVRARVTALSNGATIPWHAGTLEPSLALFPAARATAPTPNAMRGSIDTSNASEAFWAAIARDTMPAYAEMKKAFPADPLTPRIDAILAARLEALTWTDVLRVNTANAFWTYMRRYPRGPHFADARRALAAIPAALEPPPRFDIVAMPDRPAPKPADAAMLNRPFLSFDDSRFAPVPPPPPTLVPPLRAAYYDRPAPPAPPRASPGSAPSGGLPIPAPIPLGFAAKPGRIDLPRPAPPAASPVATIAKPPTIPGPAAVPGPAMVPGPATVPGPAAVPGPATVPGPTMVPVSPTTSVGKDVNRPSVPVVPTMAPVVVPEPSSPTVTPVQPAPNPVAPVSPAPVPPATVSPAPVSASPATAAPVTPAPSPSVSPSGPQPVPASRPAPVPQTAPPAIAAPPPPSSGATRPGFEQAPRATPEVPLPPRRPAPTPPEPRRPGKQQFAQPKASQTKSSQIQATQPKATQPKATQPKARQPKATQPKPAQRKTATPDKPKRPGR